VATPIRDTRVAHSTVCSTGPSPRICSASKNAWTILIAIEPSPTADAVHRAVADVTRCEDAGDAGLERVRPAVERPAPVAFEIQAGADVAAEVAGELGRQPVGVRAGADHQE
jgi:hypothetical protein